MIYKKIDFIYEISTDGTVRNSITGKILKHQIDNVGYESVSLYSNERHLVHRLVAKVHIPIPEHLKDIPIQKLQVNHKDENKSNNCVDNLEWCTAKYNINYGTGNQRRSNSQKKIKKPWAIANGSVTSKPIGQFDKDMNLIMTFSSIREAARLTSLKHQSIIRCCKENHRTCGGFYWRYL